MGLDIVIFNKGGKKDFTEIKENLHYWIFNESIVNINSYKELTKIKDYYKPSSFDYVICNPPYFPVKNMPNQREKFNHNISRHEILCNLSDVIKSIKYLLKQNGKFSL